MSDRLLNKDTYTSNPEDARDRRKHHAAAFPHRILPALLCLCALCLTGCGGGSGEAAAEAGTGAVAVHEATADSGAAAAVNAAADAGADTASERSYTLNDFYFDTVISIQFTATGDGQALLDGCADICERIEKTFSRTDEKSELYQVNHRTSNTVEVSDDLAYVISVGLEYYEVSEGKFDITIAPVSDLWDFKSGEGSVPDEDKLAEAVSKVDASKVHVDGNTVTFDSDDTMIDLGALAKGYAADQLADYLRGEGVNSGILNLGGNVLAIGTKAGENAGKKWVVGIKKPFTASDILTKVEAEDQAVVSSGVYERYFEEDGVLYHHILDPDTGYPIQDGLWEVSIICESSLLGDALSTTCLAVGEEKATEIIESMNGVEAIFVDSDLNVTYAGDA